MKFYEIIIKPESVFGTPLAGDTLFGHLCWQFVYDPELLNREFDQLINEYAARPFMVVSSGVVRVKSRDTQGYAMVRPDLALFGGKDVLDAAARREFLENRKELKRKKWLFVGSDLKISFNNSRLMSESDVTRGALAAVETGNNTVSGKYDRKGFAVTVERSHNSINRLTQTTGKGFDPYSMEGVSYLPGTTFSVFVLLDEDAVTKQSVQTAFERIGSFGYGRDASSGLGRFTLLDVKERELPSLAGHNGCFTLSPCCPEKKTVGKSWFQPLTRFGKHGGGGELSGKPHKNPVVMAAEGAVFISTQSLQSTMYLGRGIGAVSKAIPETVVQGYSIYLPCTVEV